VETFLKSRAIHIPLGTPGDSKGSLKMKNSKIADVQNCAADFRIVPELSPGRRRGDSAI